MPSPRTNINTRLDLFVLTFNRPELLEETLESIARQTSHNYRLIILDSAGLAETKEVIRKFSFLQPEHHLPPEGKLLTSVENWFRARTLIENEWLIMFHDDDLMHPEYLSAIQKIISDEEKSKKLCLLTSGMLATSTPSLLHWPAIKNKVDYLEDQCAFASYIFEGFVMNYASTVYRDVYFKKVTGPLEGFGKAADYPFVINQTQFGMSCVLADPWIQYRLHENQDGKLAQSGPYLKEIFNLINYFQKVMKGRLKARLKYELYAALKLKNLLEATGQYSPDSLYKARNEGVISFFSILSMKLHGIYHSIKINPTSKN